jgi:hypothetical protein
MRCEHCGDEFVQNKDWQRFCSTKCNNAWNYQRRKREQVQQAERIAATVQRIVAALEPVPSGGGAKRYEALVTRR